MRGMLAALGLSLAASLASQTCEFFKIGPQQYTRLELVEKFAPSVLQWAAGDGDEWQFLDLLTHIDFDGDGTTWGNRDAGKKLGKHQPPALYGDVIAVTETHAYLLYYYYHSADRGNWVTRLIPFGLGEHENDLEGGLVVVNRASGRVEHRTAMAHSQFDDRTIGRVNRDDVVWLEGGKHGAHLITLEQLKKPNEVNWGMGNRDQYAKYVATVETQAQVPIVHRATSLGEGWEGQNATPAKILPVWPLFAAMYQDDGMTLVKSDRVYVEGLSGDDFKLRFRESTKLWIYRLLRGAEGNKAKLPWGESQERFFDPALQVADRGGKGISLRYEYNPYLQTVLTHRLVKEVEKGCPVFPAHLNCARTNCRK